MQENTTTTTSNAVVYVEHEEKGGGEKMMHPMEEGYMDAGPISFSELKAERAAMEAAMEVNHMAGEFPRMVRRIFSRPDVDKDGALETLAKEFIEEARGAMDMEDKETKATWNTAFVNDLPDSSFLYVEPGDKDGEGRTIPRSKRHFPYKDSAGKVDLPHLRNAIARIPQSNAPGLTAAKKQSLQERARGLLEDANKEGWFGELVGRIKEALGLEKPQPPEPSFMLWKEADGTYTWLARYSNNFRDQDNPPEIIASKSHQHFVDLVDRGAEPPPDLWLWHRPEWRWGRGSWAAWDDKGFALAGGKVEKGFEPLAEQIMAVDPDLLRVSHGMPKDSIKRDPDDPSIIVEHVTREISPLPAWAAANQLTGFTILKEVQDMAIPKDKKDTLVGEWGLSGELLEQLEAANAADADKAAEAGIEHKEKDTDGQQAAPDEAQAEPAAAAPQAEEAPISRQELAEALGAVGEAIKLLTGQVKEVVTDLQALKEARTVEEAQSLSDIFKSAVGHPDARVDGRTTEAKDRPRQTKPEPDAVVATANPLVDGIVNSIVSGTWLDDFRQTQQ